MTLSKKIRALILAILLLGTSYLVGVTYGGNITFNMDVADDMVDLREMILLNKLRLTGNIAGGVEGLFYGPGWYYLLSIPFIISSGDPYGVTIMQIILWAIGGYFLLKLVSKWGIEAILVSGGLWLGSHYILTSIRVALNPNPVIYLLPLFIFLLIKYIETKKIRYSIGTFFLGGFFFNCEIAFGIFTPFIIFFAVLILNKSLLKKVSFWIGLLFFLFWLLPQILFDIRHDFLFSKAVFAHLSKSSGDLSLGLPVKIEKVFNAYYAAFRSGLMNQNILTYLIVPAFLLVLFKMIKEKLIKKEAVFLICLLIIFIPFLGQIFSPANIMLWHAVGVITVVPVIVSYLVFKLREKGGLYCFLSILLVVLVISLSIQSLKDNFLAIKDMRQDPAFYQNEIDAIDYVYHYADGKNFKVYTYLPSVYDYPYQYLFWWYGLKKYGYLPKEYAYLPNQPEYISNKIKFSAKEDEIKKREDSNLVFLIKEPNHNYTRFGWEGTFINLENIDRKMIGPLEIEVRRETTQ